MNLNKRQLEKIKRMLPIGATVISITDSQNQSVYKKYNNRAKVVYEFKGEKCVSYISYQPCTRYENDKQN